MFRYTGVGKSTFTLVHRENNTINLVHIFTTVNLPLLVPVFSGIAKTQMGLFFSSPVFFLWKPWRHPSSQTFLLFCPLKSITLLFNSFAFLPSFQPTFSVYMNISQTLASILTYIFKVKMKLSILNSKCFIAFPDYCFIPSAALLSDPHQRHLDGTCDH